MQDLDGIEEIFRCYICLARVKNAQMCPSCSKMCCSSCIKRWITEQRAECPHCRSSLHVSQLINCRFAADVSSELDKLRKKTQKAQTKELCASHGAPLYYYCSSCTTAVCSDCAMFGDSHKGHKFEHLSMVYQHHVELVRSEAIALRKRLKELTSLMHQVETNVEAVTKGKEERAVELAAAVEQMQARLDMQLKNKLLTLLSYKGALVEEIEHQSSMLHELNRQLAFSPKSVFIAKSEGLIASLQALYKRQAGPVPQPISTEFASEVVPPYISATCTLRDYSKLRSSGAVFYSSGLETHGQTWRLKVYPNGNGVARAHYLSVFLEMTSYKGITPSSSSSNSNNSNPPSLPPPAKYDYRIELINQKFPHVVTTREFASDFEVGECWGYNRFFRIDNLVKDGYLIPDDDVIVLRFHVRPQTYYQHCRDLKAYIAYLEMGHKNPESLDLKRRTDLLAHSEHTSQKEDKALSESSGSVLDKDDLKEWWQTSSDSFTASSPPTPPSMTPLTLGSSSSLPLPNASLPLSVSSLQRPATPVQRPGTPTLPAPRPGTPSLFPSHPTPTTTSISTTTTTTATTITPPTNIASSLPTEAISIWSERTHRDTFSDPTSSPSSVTDLQGLQDMRLGDNDDEESEDHSDDNDPDNEGDSDSTTSLFDTLSLANYELGSVSRGVYTTHSYPVSPYPAWVMDGQEEEEDDVAAEESVQNDVEDHDVINDDSEEEEDEEGLIR